MSAALGYLTGVVWARRGSWALLTASEARKLKRKVGAVPGQVTAPLSFGPHLLLRDGAYLVAEPLDVLTAVCDHCLPPRPPGPDPPRDPTLVPLFEALADGYELPTAFAEAGLDAVAGLAALAALEIGGYVRRQTGGRYCVVP
jgi:DNA processing protein